jgi:hypothetical protein
VIDDELGRLEWIDLRGIAAGSTTAGTPVKSCKSTRAGANAISRSGSAFGFQRATASTSSDRTTRPSTRRSRFSRRIFIE